MTAPSPKDLHAGGLPKDEARRKKAAEAEVVSTVAGAMAGEALAAITGKGPKKKS